jgi:hypothetical protein
LPQQYCRHRLGAHRADRSAKPEKQLPEVSLRPYAEVIREGLTNLLGKRQARYTLSFSGHDNFACTPVNVVEPQTNHFRPSQTEAHEKLKDSEVASASEGATVDASEKSPDGAHRNRLRQAGESSARTLVNVIDTTIAASYWLTPALGVSAAFTLGSIEDDGVHTWSEPVA